MSRGFTVKRAIAAIVLTLAIALLAGCGGLGSIGDTGGSGQISGQIFVKGTNQLIDDREVIVRAGGKKFTAEDGTYQLTNVPTGPTTLTAEAPGYELYEQPIDVLAVAEVINIEMTPVSSDLTGTVLVPSANEGHASIQLNQLNLWQRTVAFLRGPSAQALAGQVALSGATVQAYRWSTGDEIGDPATTDSEGKFRLEGVPVGTDILIIVKKGDLRLTSAVPAVGESADVQVDALSTFTAEVLGQHFGTQADLDEEAYNDALDAVQEWLYNSGLVEPSEVDLRPGEGWIGENFGSEIHHALGNIRDEVVRPLGDMQVAHQMIDTVRNVVPSLIYYGGPVLGDAIDLIDEKVGPALFNVVDRLSIIAELVEAADLDPLEKDEEFDFSNEEYTLYVILEDVEDLGDDTKRVTSAFEITENDGDAIISDGTMIFEIAEGRPVDSMVIDVSFYETIDEETIAVTLVADITYDWEDSLVGDIRDLKSITVTGGQLDSPDDDNLVTGIGSLVAQLDQRKEDGDTYVVVSSLSATDGIIEIDDVTIETNLTYTLSEGLDTYRLDADITILSSEHQEFKISGHLGAEGVAMLDKQTEDNYDQSDIDFFGTIELPGRRTVTIEFDAKRDKLYGLNIDEFNFNDGNVVELFGTIDINTTPGEPGEKKLFETATLSIALSNNDGYTLTITGSIDSDSVIANGDLRSPDSTLLAEIEPDGTTGAKVIFQYPGEFRTETLF